MSSRTDNACEKCGRTDYPHIHSVTGLVPVTVDAYATRTYLEQATGERHEHDQRCCIYVARGPHVHSDTCCAFVTSVEPRVGRELTWDELHEAYEAALEALRKATDEVARMGAVVSVARELSWWCQNSDQHGARGICQAELLVALDILDKSE